MFVASTLMTEFPRLCRFFIHGSRRCPANMYTLKVLYYCSVDSMRGQLAERWGTVLSTSCNWRFICTKIKLSTIWESDVFVGFTTPSTYSYAILWRQLEWAFWLMLFYFNFRKGKKAQCVFGESYVYRCGDDISTPPSYYSSIFQKTLELGGIHGRQSATCYPTTVSCKYRRIPLL